MYQDDQSIKVFERMHARDRLVEEARGIGNHEDELWLGGHLAAARQEQRVMRIFALVAIAAIGAALYFALS